MSKRDNLYLVGLMGAGKTTVGRLLARHYGCTFHDSDHEIEARTGVKIPVIFEIEGEAGFRRREEAAIAELTALSGIVLATGGGAVLSAVNRENLKNSGMVIYLRGSPEHLYERTRHDRNRPCCRPTTRWRNCASCIASAIRCTARLPTLWWIPAGRASLA
jgi:shikimate kinase